MSKEIKEKEVQVEETQETKAQDKATAVEKSEEKVVETTAKVIETKVKIPAKVRVGNFIRKHQTAIIGAVTGVTGLVTGIVLGVKIGKDSMAGSDAALPDTTGANAPELLNTNSIPIDIPENTNVM